MKFYSIEESEKYLNSISFPEEKTVFSGIIENAKAQISNVIILLQDIQNNLALRFSKESLTYDRFNGTISKVLESIIFNYDYLKKIINNFNDNDYKRMQSHNLNIDKEVQMEKLEIYESSIDRAENLITENEKIMIQLNRIISEIEKEYDQEGKVNKSKEIIDQLLDELKYYKTDK